MRPTLPCLLLLALTAPARAGERPGLDDFYDRTRDRHVGFDRCTGFCDGRRLLQALVGAQVANPSTDALRPTLAEGLRLGLDAGLREGHSVLRAAAWADLLWTNDTSEQAAQFVPEYVTRLTGFLELGESGNGALHLQGDVELAAREELEPQDFAEFQRHPYTVLDAEVEVAPTGPEVDKEAFIALPLGFSQRVRWDDLDPGGEPSELRRTLSGAFALRAFQKQKQHHYQIDAPRLTRVDWQVPAGEASAWKASLGYQRLSPDIDWLQIWLLFGWGWFDGAEDVNGFLTRVGVELDAGEDDDVGLRYDRDFALDRVERRFRALSTLRGDYRTERLRPVRLGMAYALVSVDTAGSLHVIEPEIAWRPFADLGVEIGVRLRLRVLRDLADAASFPDDQRFQFALDWLL